ncbi:NAD-dependent epimerase/dehydratase family protein [Colwellia sp. C1TZA3]|uniref:NAD-dependent epimerase/dehydratase family protein n=1 Tax=Colwellia sp. C1TZA3 TaxID=2508879 RepID=UPI0011B9C6DB|nr:NAD-dependent epimerase/dehydratase family protein [Colwellia sp. C1TZA3]TWX65105.1 oxidoreductase [Colwellia sp. C1TZA3]
MTNYSNEYPQEQPKVALIVGASGLVGQHLLQQLLASNIYHKVIALVRKPLLIEDTKLEQWQINFDHLEAELISSTLLNKKPQNISANNKIKRIDHIFFTLGTTIKKAGSKAAFTNIDHRYPLLIAKHFYGQQTSLLAIVTAMSANETSAIFYNQIKGKIEKDLSNLGYPHLGLFRPSMLSGQRDEFRLGEQLGTIVMNTLAFMIPKKHQVIQAKKVANAMLIYAENPLLGVSIIQSDQLQNY